MTPDQQKRIVEFHLSLPAGCRSAPATPVELAAFEAQHGVIPADFRWYLETCGGGVVGSEWIDDVHELKRTHVKFLHEEWPMKDVFVIGWDGAGNPMAIEHASGRIVVADHNFDGIHTLADSFADFVLRAK